VIWGAFLQILIWRTWYEEDGIIKTLKNIPGQGKPISKPWGKDAKENRLNLFQSN